MSFILRLILAVLTVYRVAELFAVDDGPYGIFRNIRAFCGKKAAGKDYSNFWFNMAGLVSCPFCIGVWFSAIALVPVYYPTTITDFVLVWLGIAGLQTYLESARKR
jgi:hypothetical protein